MKQFTKATNSLLWTLSVAGLLLQASLSSRATLRTLEVPESFPKGPGIQAPGGRRWLVSAPSRPPLGDLGAPDLNWRRCCYLA